jgi:probable phosphoglycerate mutase
MPTFLLIRHGETDYNKKMLIAGRLNDVHLNKKGRQQALVLAETLARAPIKAIYASPLERTMETAQPLAGALNLKVKSVPGLLETDCGEWQGQSIRKLRRLKIWRSLQQHPSLFAFPGGESIPECQHRIVRALETIRQKHDPKDLIACFSHSDPLKQLIAFYLGLSLDAFQRLTISTASISAMNISDHGAQLIMLNYSPDRAWELIQPPPEPKKRHPGSIVPSP